MCNLFVGSGTADRCTVSASASDLCREAATTNPHSLREQVAGIWCREKHG